MKSLNDLKIQLYADGADKAGILSLNANALIQGMTTNPTLMRKAGIKDYEVFAKDILQGVTTNLQDMGFPQASFGGQFTTMGDPALFTFRNNRDFEFYDNATFHKGRHTLKFGAYFMRFDLQ